MKTHEILKNKINLKGVKYSWIARKINVTPSCICNVLNGIRPLKFSFLSKICEVAGFNYGSLSITLLREKFNNLKELQEKYKKKSFHESF